MKIIKEEEIALECTDAFILQDFGNIIVTNDLTHFCIFDNSLKLIKKIPFLQEIGAYRVYKNFCSNQLLLDCSEEDGFLYLFDLDCEHICEIPFEECIFLGDVYLWKEDVIIFYSSKGYIYVDIKLKDVSFVSKEFVQRMYPNFFNFCLKSEDFLNIQSMCGPFEFIYISAYEEKIGVYNFLTNSKCEVSAPAKIDHDIMYSNGYFGTQIQL